MQPMQHCPGKEPSGFYYTLEQSERNYMLDRICSKNEWLLLLSNKSKEEPKLDSQRFPTSSSSPSFADKPSTLPIKRAATYSKKPKEETRASLYHVIMSIPTCRLICGKKNNSVARLTVAKYWASAFLVANRFGDLNQLEHSAKNGLCMLCYIIIMPRGVAARGIPYSERMVQMFTFFERRAVNAKIKTNHARYFMQTLVVGVVSCH